MRKQIKFYVVISIVLVVSMLFCSCQISTVSNQTTAKSGESQSNTFKGVLGEIPQGVTLRVITRDRYPDYCSMNDRPLPGLLAHMEEITGVTLDFQAYLSSEYQQIVGTLLASGIDLPDIIAPVGDVQELLATGLIVDHKPLLEKYGKYYKRKI